MFVNRHITRIWVFIFGPIITLRIFLSINLAKPSKSRHREKGQSWSHDNTEWLNAIMTLWDHKHCGHMRIAVKHTQIHTISIQFIRAANQSFLRITISESTKYRRGRTHSSSPEYLRKFTNKHFHPTIIMRPFLDYRGQIYSFIPLNVFILQTPCSEYKSEPYPVHFRYKYTNNR